MAKKAKAPKAKALGKVNPLKAAQAVPLPFGLGGLSGIAGLPGQIRDAAREAQRPPAFVPPKPKRKGKG